MGIFDYFRSKRVQSVSAQQAKERLQVIVAHERNTKSGPDFLPQMQEEILNVIRRYMEIDSNQVVVNLDDSDNCSVLELNITFAEDLETA